MPSAQIQARRHRAHSLVTLPATESRVTRPWGTAPSPLQRALARGHRWLALLTSGEAKSLKEIAAREGVNRRVRLHDRGSDSGGARSTAHRRSAPRSKLDCSNRVISSSCRGWPKTTR